MLSPRTAEIADRILMMDSYAAHLTKAVSDLAWRRGYIVLYHYGGTTALAQVNDTRVYAPFSRLYQELETECFLRRQERNGSRDIGRSNQEVIDDICETWRNLTMTKLRQGTSTSA